MSRIGRKPIAVPAGVKIQLAPGAVEVQGPKGKLNVPLAAGHHASSRRAPSCTPSARPTSMRALHGWRARWWPTPCTASPTGFKKELDIVGVGYRAELKGKNGRLRAGLFASGRVSHSRGHSDHGREADAPDRVAAPTAARSARWPRIFAALRPPDPYKQKGIRLIGERLKKKAGKAGAAKTARLDGPSAKRA